MLCDIYLMSIPPKERVAEDIVAKMRENRGLLAQLSVGG